MPELHFPWIEAAIIIPLIVSLSLWRVTDSHRQKIITSITSCIVLLLCTGEWIDFARLNIYEAHDHWDLTSWILNREILVVDALSAPLLPLAALLYTAIIATTLRTKTVRFSFRSALLSLSTLLATLSCRDAWMVILLLTLSSLPILHELSIRKRSNRIFLIHTILSILCMIFGQLFIDLSADSSRTHIIGGSLLTIGCLIRAGIFPMHCWITDLCEKSAFGTAILFLLPMTGAYAIMRLVFPIAPSYALQAIAILSLLSSIYAAAMSAVQVDIRRLFAYMFLSHSSLVLVGLELTTPIGLAGGLLVWLSAGIALLGFALALRSIEARTGRLSLQFFHGLQDQIPFLAGMFLITGLAAIGFPGTIGFIGMEMLLEGAVAIYPTVGVIVAITAAINGISIMRAYFLLFTGVNHPSTGSLACKPTERIAILLILLLIIGGGLWPQLGVHSRYHSAKELIQHRAPLSENVTRSHPESTTVSK